MKEKMKYFQLEDIEWLIEQFKTNQEQFYWTANVFPFLLDAKTLTEHLKFANYNNARRYCYKYIIDNKIIGYCELNNIDYQNKLATVSRVVIDKNFRKRGFCYKMLKNLLNFAFYDLKLHRIELLVLEENIPAYNCYLKLGFKSEGILRDIRFFNNKFYSAYLMSILENEYIGKDD
ncbi:MAG TPA: GNAT family protein [Ignavibacteriales bacterium]|nr:GNAT family protein [Ignavibacteriales bacterium]HOL80384.1 GNAT family protein [Ignavibacteriales bacterium]HOM64835.1 GNAT family protein [Ignavibacteriales bacterium]HPP32573.1 GNAT family protein [Ignavibacteriales bacterium]HRR17460.1 GNAT family protein [Ignavibacteriales bacterium]